MKLKYLLKKVITLFLIFEIISSCTIKKTEELNQFQEYSIVNSKIYHFSQPVQFIGANAFHTFGGESSDMNSWNLDIVREFVGNMAENPIIGEPIQDSNGSYLHSLQTIVDNNTLNHKVTILCPFGWDGNSSNYFTGKSPTQTSWYHNFKIKLEQWANQFKNQPNVWIEVWNEPYRYDRSDGYSDQIWKNNMNELVSIIRNTGNNNIILVPCAEQGQDESVLNNVGVEFLIDKTNILFDIHGYEKWLLTTNYSERLNVLKQNNIPFIFGEIAPINAGILMNPQPFLEQLYSDGISVCAWVWKYDENDQDALLTSSGLPNNYNNNNWGSTYKELTLRNRNP